MRLPAYVFPALLVALSLAAAAGCSPSPTSQIEATPAVVPPTEAEAPTVEAATVPANPPTVAAEPSSPAFVVAVIVDTLSEPVSRQESETVVNEASRLLQQLTPVTIVMTDFVEDGGGGSTNDMASRYIAGHSGALPNGIVIFSFGDGGQAKTYGGYSYALAIPTGFSNSFVSPVTGPNHIYVAVVHFRHKYAACGYGGSDTVQSTTSLDGECRNQPGTACVEQNGYSMCANAVGNLYMSTPTYFISSTIIHEILHSFSPGGETDHYATPECNARMGYPEGFFDLQESQYYNGLCPDVYENFVQAYQP